MLELGLVEDVETTRDEMVTKCYDAGLQSIYDEFYTCLLYTSVIEARQKALDSLQQG